MALFLKTKTIRLTKLIISATIILIAVFWIMRLYTYRSVNGPTLEVNSVNHLMYILENDHRSTSFQIINDSQQLRVLLRPIIIKAPYNTSLDNLNYSLDIRLYGSDDKLITDKRYHINQKITKNDFLKSRERLSSYKYNLQPLPSKTIIIPNSKKSSGGKIVINLVSKDPIVKEISFQIHAKTEAVLNNRNNILNKHPARRGILEKNSIYGNNNLSPEEIDYALTHQFVNLTPTGKSNRNTKTLKITTTDQPIAIQEKVSFALKDAGQNIDKHLFLTVPLSLSTQKLELNFYQPEEKTTKLPQTVTLALYKHYAVNPKLITINIPKLPFTKVINLPLSLVKISSSEILFINPKQYYDGKWENIVKATYVSAYELSTKHALSYKILHNDLQPTPIRVDLRTIDHFKASTVSYTVEDKNKQPIYHGQLKTHAKISNYELLNNFQASQVGELQSYYFLLPFKAAFLDIEGQNFVLANAYNRPYLLPRLYHVFNDFYTPLDLTSKISNWFKIQPIKSHDQTYTATRQLIRIQRRLPEFEDYVINRDYFSQKLYPKPEQPGMNVLMPIRNHKKLAASSSIYQLVRNNLNIQGNFISSYKEDYIQPSIILYPSYHSGHHSDNKKPGHLSFVMDGRTINIDYPGYPVKYTLPVFHPGKHRLSFITRGKVKIYMNYLKLGQKLYALSHIFKQQKTLHFTVLHKSAKEIMLIARSFQPLGKDASSTTKINILPRRKPAYTATEDYTFPIQEIDTTGSEFSPSLVINSNTTLNGGQPYSLKLGDDLAFSQLEIEMSTADNQNYLSLYQYDPNATFDYDYRRRSKREIFLQYAS